MDDDGSGKAAYVEFESLIRVDMHVTKQELPTRQVAQSVSQSVSHYHTPTNGAHGPHIHARSYMSV